jgi:hypothetical protein
LPLWHAARSPVKPTRQEYLLGFLFVSLVPYIQEYLPVFLCIALANTNRNIPVHQIPHTTAPIFASIPNSYVLNLDIRLRVSDNTPVYQTIRPVLQQEISANIPVYQILHTPIISRKIPLHQTLHASRNFCQYSYALNS